MRTLACARCLKLKGIEIRLSPVDTSFFFFFITLEPRVEGHNHLETSKGKWSGLVSGYGGLESILKVLIISGVYGVGLGGRTLACARCLKLKGMEMRLSPSPPHSPSDAASLDGVPVAALCPPQFDHQYPI